MTVDEYKSAMGRLAAGVTVVTTVEDDDDIAMTATAVMSVSLEPPLVLVSVGEGSRMYEVLARQDTWAASILHESQRHISSRFAIRGRVNDRLLFADLPWHRGAATGAIVLDGVLAALECRTVQRVPAGDHVLMISEVLAVEAPTRDPHPLLHFAGQYRRIRERSAPDKP